MLTNAEITLTKHREILLIAHGGSHVGVVEGTNDIW